MKVRRSNNNFARPRYIQVLALALALLTVSFAGWRAQAGGEAFGWSWRSQPLSAISPAAAIRRVATVPPRDVAPLTANTSALKSKDVVIDSDPLASSQWHSAVAATISGQTWFAALFGPMLVNSAFAATTPEILPTIELGNITQACSTSVVVNVPGRNVPQATLTIVTVGTATPQGSQNITEVSNTGCSSNGNPCTVNVRFTGRVTGDTTGQVVVTGGFLTNGVLTTTHVLIIPLHGTVLAPSLSCPADINTTTDQGQCTATVSITPPSAPGSCYSAPSGTRSDGQSLTAPYPVGMTTITWNSSATLSGITYPVSCTQKVTVTGTATPSISTPPQPQTVCAGQPATFSAGATGTGLTYQWRKGGQPINGATQSSYTIASTTANSAGSYDVVVGSACGVATVTSTPVSLTVNPATAINTPPATQTKTIGQSVTFNVGAVGLNLGYQWRKGGQAINGATQSSYTINAVTLADAGSYDVVVTGTCGMATSSAATLIVNCQTITVSNPGTTTGTAGAAFNQTFTQTGGIGTTTFSTTSVLPNGLTLASDGTLSGTPGQTGTFPIVVTATDQNGCTGTGATYNLNIACATNLVVVNDADSGAGSLRDAIASACPGSTITFANGINLITLTSGELLIDKNLTIQGPGANVLTISGNSASRVFNISSGNVTLDSLTIANGKVSGRGGGIFKNSTGTLKITNSMLSGNSASVGNLNRGGGIYNAQGTVNVTNSTLSGNSASTSVGIDNYGYGGGIYNEQGTVNVTNSTLSGNSASASGVSNCFSLGGGIYNAQGTVNVTNSTLFGNSARDGSFNQGGGIYNYGTVTITGSTLSGNSASGHSFTQGGGIYNAQGTVTITGSTLSGNSASGGSFINGGGMYSNSYQVKARNTIIAGNSSIYGPDVSGVLTSLGHNLIGNTSGATITAQTGDKFDANASPLNLAPLADNGGPTQTHALLPGSLAINMGSAVTMLSGAINDLTTSLTLADATAFPAGVGFAIQIDSEQMLVAAKSGNTLTVTRAANGTTANAHNDGAAVNPAFDQRGSGFPRKVGTAVDIGAFEVQNATPTIMGRTISQPIGSPAATAQIATVSDAEDASSALSVTATPLSGSGVTVTNFSVDANGNVTADVQAVCGATNSVFTLTVTDGGGAFATAQLIVNVGANTPPTFTYPSNPGTVHGTGITVSPLTGPSDNGRVNSIQVFSVVPAISGGITVDSAGVVTVAGSVPAGSYTVTIRATDDCEKYTDASFPLGIVKATPVITWNNPADITYGTALSATQLNASANVAGSFSYTPALNTLLNAGNGQTLSVQFTPTDTVNYNNASKTVSINVLKATPILSWSNPADIIYGTALGSTQLNASANVAGNFAYTPAANTVLSAGNNQTLSVTFTPTDTANYTNAAKMVMINVLKATPVITWSNPADITYGTALSATQLNATANAAGSFSYSPASGTVLNAGNGQMLTANFTPSDTNNYNSTSKQVQINVLKAPLTVTVNNAFRNQGQANPPFSGSITGLKNGDVITASYSTTATLGSAPGNYPITATLQDPDNRLGNYQVTNTPGTLKVFNSCGIGPVPFFATQGAVGGYWLYYQPLSASPLGLYTFSLFAGTLPPGLAIVNNFGQYTLQGAPTTRGTYTFTLLAKNTGNTCEAIHTYTITIW